MRSFTWSLIFLSMFFFCGEVGAGDMGKEKSKKHFQRAVEFYKQGKYEDALIDFQAAYDYRPHWQIKYNLAMCHYHLEHYLQAAKALIEFHKEGKGSIDTEQLKKTQGILAEIKTRIAVLTVDGDFMKGQAVVVVDGEAWDDVEPGEQTFLEPGKHHLTVKVNGTMVVDKDVTFEPGSSKEIFASQGKPVQEDHESHDAGEGSGILDTPGTAMVEHEPPGTPGKAGSRKKAAAWAVLASGAVLLAAGCVTAGLGTAKKKDMERLEDEYLVKHDDPATTIPELEAILASRDDTFEASRGLYAATYALMAAGGALVIVSITLFVLSRKEGRDEASAASIHAGPGTLQLEIGF